MVGTDVFVGVAVGVGGLKVVAVDDGVKVGEAVGVSVMPATARAVSVAAVCEEAVAVSATATACPNIAWSTTVTGTTMDGEFCTDVGTHAAANPISKLRKIPVFVFKANILQHKSDKYDVTRKHAPLGKRRVIAFQ